MMMINIKNICPDFLSFWQTARNLDRSEQKSLWKTMYENIHSDIFDIYYSRWSNPERLDSALDRYPDIIPGLILLLDGIDDRINRIIESCAGVFKSREADFNFVTMIGLFTSNGWGTDYNNRMTAFLALECFSDPRFLDILISHEAAHCFHALRNPDSESPIISIGEALFIEGIATIASSIVCPDASDMEYLWFGLNRNDWIAECDSRWPELRKFLLRDLRSVDQDTYRTYFLGDTPDESIPVRSGYYAGFRAVRSLNISYSIAEMSLWSSEKVHDEIRSILLQN